MGYSITKSFDIEDEETWLRKNSDNEDVPYDVAVYTVRCRMEWNYNPKHKKSFIIFMTIYNEIQGPIYDGVYTKIVFKTPDDVQKVVYCHGPKSSKGGMYRRYTEYNLYDILKMITATRLMKWINSPHTVMDANCIGIV